MQNPLLSNNTPGLEQNVEFGYQLHAPTIISSASTDRHGPIGNLPIALDHRLAPYSSSQHATRSTSPIELNPFSVDRHQSPPSGSTNLYTDAYNQSLMHNPKRAYRQRRKDPSCDACRERKVKCDATETTSCTECSSRNVRCQFTKDTNRRMSSIKQVQDLERQLQDARAQLERLRASEHFTDSQPQHSATFTDLELPDISRPPRRMLKARSPQDLSAARAQLLDVGRGILKPPIAPSMPDDPDRRTPPLSMLPSREITQQCLEAYLECVHRRYPIVHWPDFCHHLWALYDIDTASKYPRERVALVFAVLGVGAYFAQDETLKRMSAQLIQTSFSNVDMFIDKIGIEQGLTCFVISVYMAEINTKSTSWVWLGTAIRVAQDRGLHVQGGYWSSVEGELRKRIWYSLYVCDRIFATELGRPMLITDEDCDTEYPEVLEEEDRLSGPLHPQKPTLLLASIHVARLLAPLAKLCRSLCIPTEAIKKFEAHLAACMQLFPRQLRLGAAGPLDPLNMTPLLQFQNTRILLHRHNISPACSQEQRSASIANCADAAEDTAGVIARCAQGSNLTDELDLRLRATASFLTCTHIWRCLLFLAFTQRWAPFQALLRYSALIGDTRPINVSCGRHLNLFLHTLIDRFTRGDTCNLEEDEDLMVLLSGDLQAGTSGWVWGNNETGTLLSRRQKHSRTTQAALGTPRTASTPVPQITWDTLLSDEDLQQWGGWQRVNEAAQWLEAFQRELRGTVQHNVIHTQASPEVRRTVSRANSDKSANTARARMTIASITDA